MVTKQELERAYFDGMVYSISFGSIGEVASKDIERMPKKDQAFWMGYAAGTVVMTGGYAALQTLPFAAGTAAAEGTLLSHLGIIAFEMAPVLIPAAFVAAGVAVVSQAGGHESPSTHGYRDRMSKHKEHYPSWMRFR